MNTYTIREVSDKDSRRAGKTIEASDLTAAKRAATRSQVFQGTVLVVEDSAGNRLARRENGRWIDEAAA